MDKTCLVCGKVFAQEDRCDICPECRDCRLCILNCSEKKFKVIHAPTHTNLQEEIQILESKLENYRLENEELKEKNRTLENELLFSKSCITKYRNEKILKDIVEFNKLKMERDQAVQKLLGIKGIIKSLLED